MSIDLLVLRHGATAMSEAGLFTGARSDPPLTDRGEEQARAWRPAMAMLTPVGSFASPLQRAMSTARLAGLDDAQPLPALLEWDLGDAEATSANAYRASHPGWSLFEDGAPSGESPDSVAARLDEAIAMVGRGQSGPVVFVTHGQLTKFLVTRLLGVPGSAAGRFALGPARAALFTQRQPGVWSLTGWNVAAPTDPADAFTALT